MAVSSLPEKEQSDANVVNILRIVSWVQDATCLVPVGLEEVKVDTTVNLHFLLMPSSRFNLPISYIISECFRQDNVKVSANTRSQKVK